MAQRQTPNLVVTLSGYDNTYSVGNLLFNFFDTNGKLLTPNGIPVNAPASFNQYFFTSGKAGGAFSLQASFPVSGTADLSAIGSVSVTLTNSAGQSSPTTINFQ